MSEKLVEWYNGDEMAANILKDKYLAPGEELPYDMWNRLANEIGKLEEDSEYWQNAFYEILENWKFIPGGRINYAVGRKENVSCTNCYVIPIRDTIDWERWYSKEGVDKYPEDYEIPADSIEGIYNWLKESALTYRSTGGVGTDISVLRPKGLPVKNSGGVSPGSTSFMDLMSKSTHTVHQKLRRGALMITINVHHPDVLDFINVKQILGKIEFEKGKGDGYNNLYKLVEHANISVLITDEFLNALEKDGKYEQRWPVDSENPSVKKRVSAKKIWEAIIQNAHAHAEPGILFIDNHRRNDALHYINPAITTNPCGEQFLGAYSNCLLGHINLSKYVGNITEGSFDYTSFNKDVATAVRFLDNIITYNDGKHALVQQNSTALGERRIGLGITGLGDCLIKAGIKYDSDEAIDLIDSILRNFRNSAYGCSVKLAKEKGAFPWFERNKWLESEFTQAWLKENQVDEEMLSDFKESGIRNSFLLTVAPVGSGSIIAQTSSGLEPIFATSYTRRVRQQDGDTFKEYKTYPKVISELFEDDSNLPDYVVTAHDIDPHYRVKIQSTIQKYIDNSISSTINLKNETTVDVVSNIYKDAWKLGLKSVTVYREGSREGVLIKDKKEETEKKDEKKKRPSTLAGKTYKIPDGPGRKLYITISGFEDEPNRPFEIFISGYGPDDAEIKSIAVLISAILRQTEDIDFLLSHLGKIDSPKQGIFWHDKDAGRRYYINSVPKAVSIALRKFIEEGKSESENGNGVSDHDRINHAEECPKCRVVSLIKEEGCEKCIDCGYSKCF